MTKEQLALLKTMERIILKIRFIANAKEREGNGFSKEETIMLGDLTDAIHNIPSAITSDDFDLNFHTNIMLGGYEEKYQDQGLIKPLSVYNHILNNEI
jgi:hypothetical protein